MQKHCAQQGYCNSQKYSLQPAEKRQVKKQVQANVN